MTGRTRQVLGEALRLGAKDRATIAAELLASLEQDVDAKAGTDWTREIERRVRRIESGKAVTEDWETVKARLTVKYNLGV